MSLGSPTEILSPNLTLPVRNFCSDTDSPPLHQASPYPTEYQVPSRHPDLYYEDGNIAIITGHRYFLVHRGVLCRHSAVLEELAASAVGSAAISGYMLEDRPVLQLCHSSNDMLCFLKALYGLYKYKAFSDFSICSVLLRLATVYDVQSLRADMLELLSTAWPSTLWQWEERERRINGGSEGFSSALTPSSLPNPIMVITLAREVDAPILLPSAFYALSRFFPSALAMGYTDPQTNTHYDLSNEDLIKIFRGKEQASRYYSTFIVRELEGRNPSEWCVYHNDSQPARKRRCQIAFEAVTYTLIKDVNGLVAQRNCDPLFAILDSLLMQTKGDQVGQDNRSSIRACEACRLEYSAVVEAVRDQFWRRLPEWFELEGIENWG